MYELYFLEILYQHKKKKKLLEKEENVLKRAKYEGMKEALIYVLSLEEKL